MSGPRILGLSERQLQLLSYPKILILGEIGYLPMNR